VLRPVVLNVTGVFSVEGSPYDYLTISGNTTHLDSAAAINGLAVAAGQTITWESDHSVTRSGFTICVSDSLSRYPTVRAGDFVDST
jgi:hypothetical protein